MKSCKKAAVILCAGKGERARLGYNKTLHPLGSASVAAKSADAFSDFDEIVVVCRPEDEEFLRGQIDFPALSFVRGGETRTDSVRNALKAIKNARRRATFRYPRGRGPIGRMCDKVRERRCRN